MSNPVKTAQETLERAAENVKTSVKKEATETIREGFAQLLGIPKPQNEIEKMRQDDKQQIDPEIAKRKHELEQIAFQRAQQIGIPSPSQEERSGPEILQTENEVKPDNLQSPGRFGQGTGSIEKRSKKNLMSGRASTGETLKNRDT